MQQLIESIKLSVESENYYAALALALAIPDIAGKIDSLAPKSTPTTYKNWYNKYILSKYTRQSDQFIFLSAENCYALRCAYLHTGVSEITGQRIAEILKKIELSFPQNGNHLVWVDNEYVVIQIDILCMDILDGAQKWLKDIENDELRMTEVKNLVEIIHWGSFGSKGKAPVHQFKFGSLQSEINKNIIDYNEVNPEIARRVFLISDAGSILKKIVKHQFLHSFIQPLENFIQDDNQQLAELKDIMISMQVAIDEHIKKEEK